MILASAEKKNPRQLAERIVESANDHKRRRIKDELRQDASRSAGPGFINITLSRGLLAGRRPPGP